MCAPRWYARVCPFIFLLAAGASASVQKSQVAEVRCDDLLRPLRTARAHEVGPQTCMMTEIGVQAGGRPYRRLDVGLDGSVEGYLPKTGQYINYFTSAPDLVFPSGMNDGPIYHGVGRYRAETGHGMTIIYPDDRSWNGRMWVTVHGRGRSFKRGSMRAWDRNLDPDHPIKDLSKYEVLMLSKGYAVVKTYRTSDTLGGELQVTLEDGTFYPERNLNDNGQYIIDLAVLARHFLERRLGRLPSRTYFYGHSAGGRIGRSLNYVPGLNRDPAGRPVFDGILAGDSATGLWLPIVMKQGRDVLFSTDAERAAFVPQLEVTHQMYNSESPGEKAPWISTNYLENKRQNARILRDKGLSAKHRMYEVRRISHNGGEMLADGRSGRAQILDMSRLMDRFIDILDAWVDRGVPPPPTRSDWTELGGAAANGGIERPALAFPEVACPLGVYHQYPSDRGAGGRGWTGFAPFTGQGVEPLDGRGVFVDMNANGVWDFREAPAEAWQRLGLLRRGEPLSRAAYVRCMTAAAEQLREEGFFSRETARWYAAQAEVTPLGPAPAPDRHRVAGAR